MDPHFLIYGLFLLHDFRFNGDGKTCNDINECFNADACHVNATCTNSRGAYSCACNDGYSGDGMNCADNDEFATCANNMGSFVCTTHWLK